MLEFTSSTATPYNPKRHVARIRRIAKIRGFRVLKDWTSTWSLVDTRVEPPRALIGLWQVDLVEIDEALSTPPPAPKTRTRKPKVETVQSASPEIVDAEFAPFEPAPVEPLSTIELLQEQFDADAIFERLHLLNAKAGGALTMRHRPNEIVREAIEMLTAHGVTPAISNGGRHIKIVWIDSGGRHVFPVSHRPTGSRVRANSRAALRRLIQQAQAMEDRPQ